METNSPFAVCELATTKQSIRNARMTESETTVDNRATSACADVGTWRSAGAAVALPGRTGGWG